MRIPDGDLVPARRHRYGGGYGRRKRRRVRRFAVLAVLVLVGLAGGWFATRGAKGVPSPRACPSPSASPVAALALPAPAQVHLTVLNGTSRVNLAKQVGDQLVARHFVVVKEDNASAALVGASVVTYGAGALPAATTVAHEVPGARVVAGAQVPRGSVQLVLGSSFTRLATPAEVAAAAAPAVLAAVPASSARPCAR